MEAEKESDQIDEQKEETNYDKKDRNNGCTCGCGCLILILSIFVGCLEYYSLMYFMWFIGILSMIIGDSKNTKPTNTEESVINPQDYNATNSNESENNLKYNKEKECKKTINTWEYRSLDSFEDYAKNPKKYVGNKYKISCSINEFDAVTGKGRIFIKPGFADFIIQDFTEEDVNFLLDRKKHTKRCVFYVTVLECGAQFVPTPHVSIDKIDKSWISSLWFS